MLEILRKQLSMLMMIALLSTVTFGAKASDYRFARNALGLFHLFGPPTFPASSVRRARVGGKAVSSSRKVGGVCWDADRGLHLP